MESCDEVASEHPNVTPLRLNGPWLEAALPLLFRCAMDPLWLTGCYLRGFQPACCQEARDVPGLSQGCLLFLTVYARFKTSEANYQASTHLVESARSRARFREEAWKSALVDRWRRPASSLLKLSIQDLIAPLTCASPLHLVPPYHLHQPVHNVVVKPVGCDTTSHLRLRVWGMGAWGLRNFVMHSCFGHKRFLGL